MATKFVNQVYFEIPFEENHKVELENIHELDKNAFLVKDLVTESERKVILENLENSNWLPVSVTGMSGNYTPGDPIGSWRASNFTKEYSEALWERIKNHLPKVRVFDDSDNTDWDDHEVWEPIGVSPLLRFIKYNEDGWLVVHYDSPYIESEDVRTLQSLVIYLQHDDDIAGGSTRFIDDPQWNIPVKDRDLSDQMRAAEEHEVKVKLSPNNGSAIIFDHRLLHDAEIVKGQGSKIIIRTDIMYRKVK